MSKFKRLTAVFVALCLVAVMLPAGLGSLLIKASAVEPWDGIRDATGFAGGSGTEDDPYQISNGEELAYLADQINNEGKGLRAHYELTADIDLGGYAWTPIGTSSRPFYGVFDGKDHTIRNYTMSVTTNNERAGFFAYVRGDTGKVAYIRNVHLESAAVTIAFATNEGGSFGGLVGIVYDTVEITNGSFDGNITVESGNNKWIGGLVGYFAGGANLTLENCWTAGTINSGTNKGKIGGILPTLGAETTSVTMKNCYSAMDMKDCTFVSSGWNSCGGLFAEDSGGTVELYNCHFAGKLHKNNPHPIAETPTGTTLYSRVYYTADWCSTAGTTAAGAGITDATDTNRAEERSATEFADGTVTDLLNGDSEKKVWMQGLKYPIIVQDLPVLTELSVDFETITLIDGIVEYDVEVEDTMEEVPVTAHSSQYRAVVTVNGAEAGGVVALGIPGTTTNITITVTKDQTMNTYTVGVYRKPTPWDGKYDDTTGFAGGNGSTVPYQISNGAQLAYMADQINKGIGYNSFYELIADIDLNDHPWIPIAYSSATQPFYGVFKGNGHTIDGLLVDDTKTDIGTYAGLFGKVQGHASRAVINDVNVKGTISAGKTATNVGGLIGYAANGTQITLTNCSFDGTITQSLTGEKPVGGLIGVTHNTNVVVTNCYTTGTISGDRQVGGLVGRLNRSNADAGSTFTNCWTSASLSATGYGLGGLIGMSSNAGTHSIQDSFVLSPSITGTSGVGGLVGRVQTNGNSANVVYRITDCYVTSTLTGDASSGGLFGSFVNSGINSSVTITDCHFAGDITSGSRLSPIASSSTAYTAAWSGAEAGNYTITANNVYYLEDCYQGTVSGITLTNPNDEAPQKSAAEFADGTVATLLNGAETPVWATAKAGYPVLSDLAANSTVNNALSIVGTSIRSKGSSQGIRFKFAISKESQSIKLKEAGAVVARLTDSNGNIKEVLADENLIMHDLQKGDEGYYQYQVAKAYVEGNAKSAFVNYTKDQDWFAVALVNFNTPEKLVTKYIARSYAVFVDSRGQEILVYGDAIGDKHYYVSVKEVAKAIWDDEDLRAQLTEDELAYIKELVPEEIDYTNADWNKDGVLKILAIGNSFSQDSMEYVYDIARAAGVQQIYLGNMYVPGCTLAMHLEYLQNDDAVYKYYVNENGSWDMTTNYKLADAIKAENWDFISFQQGSAESKIADTYNDLGEFVNLVVPHCTNPDVEFVWHMTWAYQVGHGSYVTLDSQLKMYNDIVSAVRNKVLPDERISKVIPNGTAIQNARTSYMGDTFTRDGYHLTYETGRLIAAMTYVHTLVGIDWNAFNTSALLDIYSDDGMLYFNMAIESVRNAVNKPFAVTESSFKEK